MLIDLEELAGNIASKVDGARLTPVIEKEIVHYEIIRSLGRTRLSGPLGGTACFKTSLFKAGLHYVSATDRNDIAKTSISLPAISSIRSPWTISQGPCVAIC